MERFKNKDIWLSSYLSLKLKNTPKMEVNADGSVCFVFHQSTELKAAVADYFSGATLPCVEFSEAVKGLKGKMYTVKERGARV